MSAKAMASFQVSSFSKLNIVVTGLTPQPSTFNPQLPGALGQGREGPIHDVVRLLDSVAPGSSPAGKGISRKGSGGGPRGGVSAVCSGAQVSGGGEGLALAVFVSGTGRVHGPAQRSGAAPSRGPGRGEQGHQSGGTPGGLDQGHQRAHLPAQFREKGR